MPRLIERPTVITAAGNKPKLIEEFVGRVNTGEERLSIARMTSPALLPSEVMPVSLLIASLSSFFWFSAWSFSVSF